MDSIKSIADLFIEAIYHNIILISVIVFTLVVARILLSKFITVINNKTTYILVTMNGFSRTLEHTEFLWNPFEWVLKRGAAPDWSFKFWDEEGKGIVERSLLDKKTGCVDLRIQQPQFKFNASLKDQHNVSGFVEVQFKLDSKLIKNTLKVADFGPMLTNHVLSALCEELGEYTEPEIRNNIKAIQTNALNKLKEELVDKEVQNSTRREASETAQLGVIFEKLTCHIEEAGVSEHTSAARRPGDPAFLTAMSFTAQELSYYRNQFLGDEKPQGVTPEALQMANAAVLQILEMHTRLQIAKALVQSGHLVILSADELGLSGNILLREKMRALVSNIAAGNREISSAAIAEKKGEVEKPA